MPQEGILRQPVSLKAALTGIALSAVIGVGDQYAADRLGAVFTTYAHLPTGLLIPYFALIFGPNLLLRKLAPRHALDNPELIVVFSMGLIASMGPDWGITRYMVSAIAAPGYFPSPENRWGDYILPYLPTWTYLTGEGDVARSFFEGLQPGQPLPWGPWAIPLFWWLSLIAALLVVGACLVVVFRKQWVDYERLRFPMGEVALQLIGDPRVTDAQPKLRANPVFQIGFALTFLMMVWNCLTYWTLWPHFPITPSDLTSITTHPAFPPVPVYFNIYVLCFAFFAHAEILFSLWVMQVFGILEQGTLSLLGIGSASSSVVQGGLVGIQYMGGILAFVAWMVWITRHHLADVWRAALGRSTTLDEGEELMSYRTALIGLAVGSLYIVGWLYQTGVSVVVAVVFLLVFFTFYLALARVTAESGLVMAELTVKANAFTVGVFGSANLTPSDLTTMGMANGFARNWRSYSMIGFFHTAWLKSRSPRRQGNLFTWLCLALGVSVLGSVVTMIHSGYSLGANNLFTTPGGFGTFFFNNIPAWANDATRMSSLEVGYLLSGVLLNSLIIAGRYLAPWWPLHPIGMAVGDVGGVVRNAMLPLFLAWLTQSLLLRFGGARLYHKAQPFFIGMLAGFVVGVALSFVVDVIWFPASPHQTEWY